MPESPPGTGAVPAEMPIVMVISSDPRAQSQILRKLSGAALVVLAPDGQTARAMLTQIERDRHSQQLARLSLPPDWVIDHRRHEVSWQGIALSLTHHEYDLFTVMSADFERVWTHDHLHLAVWKSRYLATATDLQSTIKRMRKKFRAAGVPIGIESVRGVGFRLHRLA